MKPSRAALLAQPVAKQQATAVTILALLATRGALTDDELVRNYAEYQQTRSDVAPRSPSAIRTTRHALVDRGLVCDTGKRRETAYGFPATVWALAEA